MARGDSELRPSVQCCHWANTAAGPSVHSSVTAGTLLLAQYLLTREGKGRSRCCCCSQCSLQQPRYYRCCGCMFYTLSRRSERWWEAPRPSPVCHFLRTVPLPLSSSASSPASAERAARAIRLAAPLNVEQVRMRAAISCTICSEGQRPQSGLFVVIIRT